MKKIFFFIIFSVVSYNLKSQIISECDSIFKRFYSFYDSNGSIYIYQRAPVLLNASYPLILTYNNDTLKPFKIWIRFIINKEGITNCAEIIKSENELFNTVALNLIEKLRFKPALISDKPVESVMLLPISFNNNISNK